MKRKTELFLPNSIYSKELIDRAIEDYRSICSIKAIKRANGVLCVFRKSIADMQLTENEFANYLIELANAHGEL